MMRRLLLVFACALVALGLRSQEHLSFEAKVVPAVARAGEQVRLVVTVTIDSGWHAYGRNEKTGKPIMLSVAAPKGLSLHGEPVIPDGEHELKPIDQWVLHDVAELSQALTVDKDAKPGEIEVKASSYFMVCDENSCMPPADASFSAKVTIEAGPARAEFLPKAAESRPATASRPATKASEPPTKSDADSGLWLFLLAAVGWGLFALAMPCTYPMIPITISFFTKQASLRGGNVLPLALTYGLGIVAIFVVIGVVVGEPISAFALHWITQLVIGVAFVVFALSLFGLIRLEPPQALTNVACRASARGGYVGVFLMGLTFVVSSFTCTAPFVGSLLAIGAKGGETGRVALGMGVFGLTMAVPFALLALMPGKVQRLPRSGEWMHVLKVFLGFVELAAALKFLSTVEYQFQLLVLPRELFLLLWTVIFGAAGLFLLGRIHLKEESGGGIGPGRLVSGLSVVLLASYFAFGAFGNKLDWITESIAPPYHATSLLARTEGGEKTPTNTVEDDYDGALARAQAEDKWLLVNFTGFG